MSPLLPYATALLLGSLHALEADHMAAVTAFALRRPAPLAAARFGWRWALGHGAAVAVAGLLLLSIGFAIPDSATGWLERAVGVALIGLGGWTAWHASHLHAHVHRHDDNIEHVHLHSHAFRAHHDHEHAATMIGVLHGAAGAAPVVALMQMMGFDSTLGGLGYLLAFATGTAAGMALYALLVGYLVGRTALAAQRWTGWLGRLTGASTIAIGILWLLR
jgi:ABC-type nickel/cobalt efflux system permease component RcnA